MPLGKSWLPPRQPPCRSPLELCLLLPEQAHLSQPHLKGKCSSTDGLGALSQNHCSWSVFGVLGADTMLDACFRCGLMSAKWREINLSLIYWPCSANTAQVLLVIPAARTHFWHGIISVSPRTTRVSSENLPLRWPDPSLNRCQRLFAFVCPSWIAQFVLKVWVKVSPCLVPFQAIHMTGNQTNSHEPGEPLTFLLFALGQTTSPLCFNFVI